jgi:hypothetical protein
MPLDVLKEYKTSTTRGRKRNPMVAIKTIWEKED